MQVPDLNKPMRYEGFTLYQANWNEPINGLEFSGFEVVTNPVHEGPEICMWISAFGLLIHFAMKLIKYLEKESRKQYMAKRGNQKGEA